jgi:hypothetical protein
MRDHEETIRRAIIAAGPGLQEGDPTAWTELDGYHHDDSEPPQIWCYGDGTETFYIYSESEAPNGDERVHERYDNAPCSVAEMEQTAVAVLSALKRAYDIERQRTGK